LPFSTKAACEVLRGWPYLMFLATGLFLLLWGMKSRKWWAFGLVGLMSGLNYWIRPESIQLLFYGLLWVLMCTIRPKLWGIRRWKVFAAFALLFSGFLLPAIPYIKCTERTIPSEMRIIKSVFTFQSLPDKSYLPKVNDTALSVEMAGIVPGKILESSWEIFKTIGENLKWFFLPALIIGLYYRFRGDADYIEMFLITTFVFVNMTMMILRYCYRLPHVSQRWSLPLVVFTVFYIPIGLRVMGNWLNEIRFHRKEKAVISKDRRLSWFIVLLLIGVGISIPKLLRPVGFKKHGYRDAAIWLSENTDIQDVVATDDSRICFYAERKGLLYSKKYPKKVPKRATYFIRIVNNDKVLESDESYVESFSCWVNKRTEKKRIIIYKVL
jgi:hypothetical protein